MYIYIDESGIFANPGKKDTAVSCVGALVIPEPFQKYIFKRFKNLKVSWGIGSGEPKGSKLDEKQVAYVISILRDYDVFVTACAIDIGRHSDEHIATHKKGQAANTTKNITPELHPDLVKQLEELGNRILQLSDPLYVQSCLLTALTEDVLNISTLYYCQRIPATLSNFRWVIDAKDKEVTDYEDLWSTTVMPMMQSSSLREPMACLQGGDYSWFDRKFDVTTPTSPDHLKPHIRDEIPTEPFFCCDVRKIMSEHLSFESSANNLGLQLVDVIVNAIRRAFRGNLQPDGWGDLGRLMVSAMRDRNSLRMLALNDEVASKRMPDYARIIKHFDNLSKPMSDDEFTRKLEKEKS